jgi:membrane protein DedA with SNARE-associated domain/putative flippase GtrA
MWSFVRNKYVAAVALLSLVLGLIEITHVVKLPYGAFVDGLLPFGSAISTAILVSMTRFGYPALFILMFLESASLPIPSEVVLPFAGYLVYLGLMSFAGALLVSTSALMLGALVDYYLALKLGRPFVVELMKWFQVRQKHIETAEYWVSNKGSWSILVARFIPGLRSIISLPAGVLKMKMKPFFSMTLAGSLGWSILLIYLGYSAGPLWNAALDPLSKVLARALPYLIVAISAACLGLYILARTGGGRQGPLTPEDQNMKSKLFTLDYWRHFIKFNVVGISGVLVNEGLLVLLTLTGLYYLYSAAVAIEVSILSNFILNDFWTFRDRRHGHIVMRMVKFNGLMTIGLAVNVAIVYFATTYLNIHYALSNFIGIAVAFILRYGLSVKYAWMKKAKSL